MLTVRVKWSFWRVSGAMTLFVAREAIMASVHGGGFGCFGALSMAFLDRRQRTTRTKARIHVVFPTLRSRSCVRPVRDGANCRVDAWYIYFQARWL